MTLPRKRRTLVKEILYRDLIETGKRFTSNVIFLKEDTEVHYNCCTLLVIDVSTYVNMLILTLIYTC